MIVSSKCKNGVMLIQSDPIGTAELSDLGEYITIKGLDNPVYYFNRIKVQEEGKGTGKEIMIEVCRLADEHGITIINEMNPYGKRNMTQLRDFFLASGFEDFPQNDLSFNTMVRKPKRPV